MESTTQSAINVIVQSPDNINIIKDIIIPFVSILLGAFVGGIISYKLSLNLTKRKYEFDSLDQAFTVIHRVSDATFFLAINYDKQEYFDKYSESITLFREFFTLKTNQNLINEDVCALMKEMSEIVVQKGNPGKEFVKQCFALNHELDEMRKKVDDKIAASRNKKW